jgi:formamidopyrimidine-DNA glycosylase
VPELPEVETVVRDLRPELIGRLLGRIHRSARNLRRKWQPEWDLQITGRRIQAINRRGKWIHIALDTGPYLVVHLGMTGQLQVHGQAISIPAHTHLRMELDSGERELRFTDIRRFGSFQFFQNLSDWESSVTEPLGPEPWDLTPEYWKEKLKKANRNLKALLLDQSIVAGVGNIYADESLFHAGIHPTTLASQLSARRGEKLRQSVVEILTRAIELRGSTIRNYVGGSGLKGGYQDAFFVYGRTNQPCLKCSKPIECIRLAGRSTHYCPRCQKA